MSIRVTKKAGNCVVKDGTYEAVVDRIEEKRDDDKHFYLFHFHLTTGGYRGARLTGLVSPALETGSDLDRWLTAILGREIEIGEELDLETALPGKRCRVKVETVRKGDRLYSNVIDVLGERS